MSSAVSSELLAFKLMSNQKKMFPHTHIYYSSIWTPGITMHIMNTFHVRLLPSKTTSQQFVYQISFSLTTTENNFKPGESKVHLLPLFLFSLG